MKKTCFTIFLCVILIFFSGCFNSTQQDEGPSAQDSSLVSSSVSSPQKVIGPSEKQWNKSSLLSGLKKIIERGTLIVAMIQADVDAFCMTSADGSLNGIDVQWAEDIANSLGVKLTISRECDTYDKLADMLINGQADLVISTYSLTTDRSVYVSLSDPYLTVRLGVMVNKQELVKNKIESNPIDYMKNNHIKLAVLRNSSHVETIAEMFPSAEIVEMDTYNEICTAARNGDVFGYLCGEVEFLFDYNRDPELSLYTKVFTFSDALDKYCIGVDPNNRDLLRFVNTCIKCFKTTTIKDVERCIGGAKK